MKNIAGHMTQLYKQYVFSCTYNQLSIVKFKGDSQKKLEARACNRSLGKTWQGKPLETLSLTKIHIFL